MIRQILEENKELADTEMIERLAKKGLMEKIRTGEILVITGVRRCGKSYLMINILKEMMKKANALYVNFEDERFLGFDAEGLAKLYSLYIEAKNPKGEIYFFFDEIQEVKNWEKWIRRMHDSKKAKFVITGSNASLLSKEIASLLAGRSIQIKIFPFSFSEFLSAKKFQAKYFTDTETAKIRHFLNEYIEFGGFPKVVLQDDEKEKRSVLSGYVDTIIYKDVVARFSIKNMEGFAEFVKYLVTNSASSISYYKMKNIFNIGIDTVKNYIFYLKTAFLIFDVPIFSYKIKDQMQYPRKVYCIDNGIITNFSFRFMENRGKLIENLVFTELLRREKEIFYWKDAQREVDFVIKEGLKVKEIIQVCSDLENERTKKREVDGLIRASEELKCNNLLVINENIDREENIEGKRIIYKPLWKWLLG